MANKILADRPLDDPHRKVLMERYSIPEPNSGCWLWIGDRNWKGYGRLSNSQARQRLAHRYSYESYIGAVPDGLKCTNAITRRA